MMMKRTILVSSLMLFLGTACFGAEVPAADAAPPPFGHRLLYYVPNRLLDVVDLLRLRGRVGLGSAASARATEWASVFVGSYDSWYLGFPGPRHPYRWRKPWGKEVYRGISVGKVDATDENPTEPDYTPTEFTLGFQLVVIGAEIGTDPVEWWDLLAGLVMVDPRGDDL